MNRLKEVLEFVKRHVIWIGLLIISIYLLNFQNELIETLIIIVAIESVACALSGVALYVYTEVNFIKLLMQGDDLRYNLTERYSVLNLLGQIFMGVHILIGLIVLGVYIAQFSN